MSASRLTMVILCMTMSKMRRSSDCHLRRAALLKVWLEPFLGNFFLQPKGKEAYGQMATPCWRARLAPGRCLGSGWPQTEDASVLLPHCPTLPFPPSKAGQEISPAGFVSWHLILIEGHLWAQSLVTATLCQHRVTNFIQVTKKPPSNLYHQPKTRQGEGSLGYPTPSHPTPDLTWQAEPH